MIFNNDYSKKTGITRYRFHLKRVKILSFVENSEVNFKIQRQHFFFN